MKKLIALLALLPSLAFGQAHQSVTVAPNGTGTGTFNTTGITYYNMAAFTYDFTNATVKGINAISGSGLVNGQIAVASGAGSITSYPAFTAAASGDTIAIGVGSGTATTIGLLSVVGGSGSNGGPLIEFTRNSSLYGALGTDSAYLGGASNNIDLAYNVGSSGSILQFLNAGSVEGSWTTTGMTDAGTLAVSGTTQLTGNVGMGGAPTAAVYYCYVQGTASTPGSAVVAIAGAQTPGNGSYTSCLYIQPNVTTSTNAVVYGINIATTSFASSGSAAGGYMINVAAPGAGMAGALNLTSGAVNLGTGAVTLTNLVMAASALSGTFIANGTTAVVVSNTNVVAGSKFIYGLKTIGGTPGGHPYESSVTVGTGFSVKATALDTSTYNYTIIN